MPELNLSPSQDSGIYEFGYIQALLLQNFLVLGKTIFVGVLDFFHLDLAVLVQSLARRSVLCCPLWPQLFTKTKEWTEGGGGGLESPPTVLPTVPVADVFIIQEERTRLWRTVASVQYSHNCHPTGYRGWSGDLYQSVNNTHNANTPADCVHVEPLVTGYSIVNHN